MFKFGVNSIKELESCHNDLVIIAETVLKISDIDFTITDGYRDITTQQIYFKEGKSKCDGINIKSKHNYFPSLAMDICPIVEDKLKWDNEHLSYLIGIFKGVSELLYLDGKITHKLRWGGNFDMDGEILEQSFDDRPHIELYKP